MKGVGKAKRARRPAGDQRAGEPPFGTLRWRRAAPAAEDSGLGGLVPLNLGGLFLDRRLQLAAVAGGLLADARRLAGAATQVVELRTAHGTGPGVCDTHRRALRRGGRCRTRSEEHTSELQSLMRISYAVFCLQKKNKNKRKTRAETQTIKHEKAIK